MKGLWSWFGNLKLKFKFLIFGLVISLAPVIGISAIFYQQTKDVIIEDHKNALTGIRGSRASQLHTLFQATEKNVTYLASTRRATSAVVKMAPLYREVGSESARSAVMGAFQESQFATAYRDIDVTFKRYKEWMGFYDIFLIDMDGNTIYTVAKEADLFTNLISGPYASSSLGKIYQEARRSSMGKVALSDMEFYQPSNAMASFFATPILSEGRQVGVLAFQFSVKEVDEILTNREGMGQSGESYLVSPDDFMMRSNSRVVSESTILSQKAEHESIMRAAKGETGVMLTDDYQSPPVPVISAYQPFEILGRKLVLISEINQEEVLAPVDEMTRNAIILTGGTAIVVFILAILMATALAGPITRIETLIHEVATEHDMTFEIPVEYEDEIGDMAKEMNSLLKLLNDTFISVNDSTGKVGENAGEVFQRASKNRERAEHEEKQIKDIQKTVAEMGGTAGEVQQTSQAQKDAAHTSNQRIQELLKSVDEVENASKSQSSEVGVATERVVAMGETGALVVATAGKQGEAVAKVTASMNEITKAVDDMTQATIRATEHGQAALEAAQDGATSVNATVEGMRSIAESSDQISEIISVITEIAEQTNLLALNAAIEAARAGAHGKGFAVVADEVGKLAQRSSEAAKEITQLIKNSASRVAEGTTLTDTSQSALQKIADGGRINMQAIEEISRTANVLASGISEVNKMTDELNALASQIAENAGKQGDRRQAAQNALTIVEKNAKRIVELITLADQTARQIGQEMEGIAKRSEQIEGMTTIQAGRSKRLNEITDASIQAAHETVKGAGEVVGISEKLRNLSESLAKQVDQFKHTGKKG